MRRKIFQLIALAFLLYVFFVSISLIGGSFKHLGKAKAKEILTVCSNPFIALFIGILVTSMVQSSSTVTSLVVGLVGSGVLSIPQAIPIIMGANVGTSVTNTLVSIGHITRREEFKRAINAATVHDFFNLLAIIVIFPLELIVKKITGTGVLEGCAGFVGGMLTPGEGFKAFNPLKAAVKPIVKFIIKLFGDLPNVWFAIITLSIAGVLLFLSLYLIVKLMKALIVARVEVFLDKLIGHNPFQGLILGVIITAIVQSSSVTTSLLVPMAAAGIVGVRQVLSITLGANIGTTITALLASLAAGPGGITIAFVHLFFNIFGCIIFWPGHKGGNIPVYIAEKLGNACLEKRYLAFVYIGVTFFLVPILLIFISQLFK